MDSVLTVRPLQQGEEEPILAVYRGMSAASRRSRFLMAMPDQLPGWMMDALVDVDGQDHVCLVAAVDDIPVGIGRWRKLSHSATTADVAVALVDDYQGQGIGTLLALHLVKAAQREKLSYLTCVHAPGNAPAARLASRFVQELALVSGGVVDRRFVIADDPDLDAPPPTSTWAFNSGHGRGSRLVDRPIAT